MMIQLIRKIFPDKILRYLYSVFAKRIMTISAYCYDCRKYNKYSDTVLLKKEKEIIGNIVKHYHVIEKGLTMPKPRLGFGQGKVRRVIFECNRYIDLYGTNEFQLKYAISVVKEYKLFHDSYRYKLDDITINRIDHILEKFPTIKESNQKEFTKDIFFANIHSSFMDFSKSRHSVRNYCEEDISIATLESALAIANNAPSACNRQCWRTHIFTDKEIINTILNIQGGNRGFGHLTNKLIIITAELSVFAHVFERNQAFVDGGIYTMNLLYSLHYNKIAACTLNCSVNPKRDKLLHKVCDIDRSEVFIAMLSCGIPAYEFKVPSSPRYNIEYTNTFH